MCKKLTILLAAIALMFPTQAHAWPVRIGIGIGIPIGGYWGPGYYRPYYGYPYYGYPYYPGYPGPYPAPVVVGAPPVVMAQPGMVAGTTVPTTPPVIVGSPPPAQPAPYAPTYPANPTPNMPSSPGQAPISTGPVLSTFSQGGVDTLLQRMNQSEESVRRDAIMDLGRMKADRAIDPLTNTLNTDSSPVVRDAAARSLGLIGSSRALPALIRAAQADNDRDVRHSAQFAIEIIRSQIQR